MKLALDENALDIYGRDDRVAVRLVPRRSCPGEQTRMSIEVPGLPPVAFLPEAVQTAPPPADWVWHGDHAGAMKLAELGVETLLGAIASGTDPSPAEPSGWRNLVMGSLGAV